VTELCSGLTGTFITKKVKMLLRPSSYFPSLEKVRENVVHAQTSNQMIKNLKKIMTSMYHNKNSYQVRMVTLTLAETLKKYPFFLDCSSAQKILDTAIHILELLSYNKKYIDELKIHSIEYKLKSKKTFITCFLKNNTPLNHDVIENILRNIKL
jgi:hypothetical protein